MEPPCESISLRTFSVASPVFCFLRGAAGLFGSFGSRGFRGFFSFGLSSAIGLPSGPTSFFLRWRFGFSGPEALADFDVASLETAFSISNCITKLMSN